MYWWEKQNQMQAKMDLCLFLVNNFSHSFQLGLKRNLGWSWERNAERRSRQPTPCFHTSPVCAYSALCNRRVSGGQFPLGHENDTRVVFQVADTETKGLFMVPQFCLLCPLETGFSNIRSLLNPGFKAIFIQREMCMEIKPLEIEDSTVCFSTRSPLCLGKGITIFWNPYIIFRYPAHWYCLGQLFEGQSSRLVCKMPLVQ